MTTKQASILNTATDAIREFKNAGFNGYSTNIRYSNLLLRYVRASKLLHYLPPLYQYSKQQCHDFFSHHLAYFCKSGTALYQSLQNFYTVKSQSSIPQLNQLCEKYIHGVLRGLIASENNNGLWFLVTVQNPNNYVTSQQILNSLVPKLWQQEFLNNMNDITY